MGVDVIDADTGAFVAHIDVTPHGAVNSVAIHNGLAALAVEAESQSTACPSCDRRNPGKVLFYDTLSREQSGGNYYLAIANEVVAPGQTTANTTLYRIESDQADDSEE